MKYILINDLKLRMLIEPDEQHLGHGLIGLIIFMVTKKLNKKIQLNQHWFNQNRTTNI
jgi:hypothetical protein